MHLDLPLSRCHDIEVGYKLENDVLAIVMMWYMMDYEINGSYIGTKMIEVYNVAKAIEARYDDCDLGSFYETLQDAKNCFDRLHSGVGKGGTWLMMHTVTLGRPDGGKLPFSPHTRASFVVKCGNNLHTIFLRPQVNALNVAEIACTALFARRIFEQSRTENNKNDRFVDKCVKTVFVDTCSGRDYVIPNDHTDNVNIDRLIIAAIRAHCAVHHQAIERFCAFHNNDEYSVLGAYNKRKITKYEADYVCDAINRALEESDLVLPMLDKRLDKALQDFKKWASK